MTNIKIAVNDSEPLEGHWGNLTPEQIVTLKNIWRRLFELFNQKVEKREIVEAPAKKGGFFGFGKREVKETSELFVGATSDPSWMTLPLEKAIPLIPGALLRKTFWNLVNSDNPDCVILRYCRARKWDEDAIYNMLVNTLRWRIANRLDDIVNLGEEGLRVELNRLNEGWGDLFVQQMHRGKVYLGGPDKEGRGICFINVYRHLKEDQPPEVIKLITLFIMENSRVIVHQPIESSCVVFNLEFFTLKNMDFDFVKFFVHCLEQHYPETLGQCLIHKAPWVFSTIWNLITPLLDPVVASKIHFTNSVKDLQERVDDAVLPGNINGEEGKLNRGEIPLEKPLLPGTLGEPDTEKYRTYQNVIEKHETATVEWIKQKEESDHVISNRRALALELRRARYAAESDIRGPSSYSSMGMGEFTPEGRCILDYGSPGWIPLDITDTV